jgi:hypothetical protein
MSCEKVKKMTAEKMNAGERWIDKLSDAEGTYLILEVDRDEQQVKIEWFDSGRIETLDYVMFEGDVKLKDEADVIVEEPLGIQNESANVHIDDLLSRQKDEVSSLKSVIDEKAKEIRTKQQELESLKDALIIARRMLDAGERKVKRLKIPKKD